MTTSLIRYKSFWALWATQALGAFNDNFFRSAFITLLTYHFVRIPEATKPLLISAAFGLFMLPFFLFSPLAGQLADQISKSRIIRWIKGAEIIIVALSTYGFISQNPYFLLGALFCMGTHSAFFGPAKYALLPELLPEKVLLKGNGYIEGGAFFAIMGGTLLGAFIVHQGVSPLALCAQFFIVSLLGFLTSFALPAASHHKTPFKPKFSWIQEVRRLYALTQENPLVFKAIVGIAWFWFVGSLLLTQLPSFAKEILQVDEGVFIFLLLVFTLGIGVGSMLCHALFRGEITLKYTPLLAFLMIPFLFDLSTFTAPLMAVETWQGLHLILDIFLLSAIGGIFVVPLYTFLQANVLPGHLSQVIAFNDIVTAGAIVFVSVASISLLSLGVSIPMLIVLTGVGQVLMTLYLITGVRKEKSGDRKDTAIRGRSQI